MLVKISNRAGKWQIVPYFQGKICSHSDEFFTSLTSTSEVEEGMTYFPHFQDPLLQKFKAFRNLESEQVTHIVMNFAEMFWQKDQLFSQASNNEDEKDIIFFVDGTGCPKKQHFTLIAVAFVERTIFKDKNDAVSFVLKKLSSCFTRTINWFQSQLKEAYLLENKFFVPKHEADPQETFEKCIKPYPNIFFNVPIFRGQMGDLLSTQISNAMFIISSILKNVQEGVKPPPIKDHIDYDERSSKSKQIQTNVPSSSNKLLNQTPKPQKAIQIQYQNNGAQQFQQNQIFQESKFKFGPIIAFNANMGNPNLNNNTNVNSILDGLSLENIGKDKHSAKPTILITPNNNNNKQQPQVAKRDPIKLTFPGNFNPNHQLIHQELPPVNNHYINQNGSNYHDQRIYNGAIIRNNPNYENNIQKSMQPPHQFLNQYQAYKIQSPLPQNNMLPQNQLPHQIHNQSPLFQSQLFNNNPVFTQMNYQNQSQFANNSVYQFQQPKGLDLQIPNNYENNNSNSSNQAKLEIEELQLKSPALNNNTFDSVIEEAKLHSDASNQVKSEEIKMNVEPQIHEIDKKQPIEPLSEPLSEYERVLQKVGLLHPLTENFNDFLAKTHQYEPLELRKPFEYQRKHFILKFGHQVQSGQMNINYQSVFQMQSMFTQGLIISYYFMKMFEPKSECEVFIIVPEDNQRIILFHHDLMKLWKFIQERIETSESTQCTEAKETYLQVKEKNPLNIFDSTYHSTIQHKIEKSFKPDDEYLLQLNQNSFKKDCDPQFQIEGKQVEDLFHKNLTILTDQELPQLFFGDTSLIKQVIDDYSGCLKQSIQLGQFPKSIQIGLTKKSNESLYSLQLEDFKIEYNRNSVIESIFRFRRKFINLEQKRSLVDYFIEITRTIQKQPDAKQKKTQQENDFHSSISIIFFPMIDQSKSIQYQRSFYLKQGKIFKSFKEAFSFLNERLRVHYKRKELLQIWQDYHFQEKVGRTQPNKAIKFLRKLIVAYQMSGDTFNNLASQLSIDDAPSIKKVQQLESNNIEIINGQIVISYSQDDQKCFQRDD